MVVLASGRARDPQSLALGPLTPRKLLLELGWLHSLEAPKQTLQTRARALVLGALEEATTRAWVEAVRVGHGVPSEAPLRNALGTSLDELEILVLIPYP